MVNKIVASAEAPGRWGLSGCPKKRFGTRMISMDANTNGAKPTAAAANGQARSGKVLWNFLRPRLHLLVDLQKKVRGRTLVVLICLAPLSTVKLALASQFGDIHSIYLTNRSESLYEQLPIPTWIRDPDSYFSQRWDLAQIIALLYVTLMVSPPPVAVMICCCCPVGDAGMHRHHLIAGAAPGRIRRPAG